jgi:hypothetical protein
LSVGEHHRCTKASNSTVVEQAPHCSRGTHKSTAREGGDGEFRRINVRRIGNERTRFCGEQSSSLIWI